MFDVSVSHIFDDSFAVWTIGSGQPRAGSKFLRTGLNRVKSDPIQSEMDIHIYEWIMTDSSETKAFIDFGIRIYNVKRSSTIGFFIPFSVDDNEIQDLTMKLGQKSIADGLFNTNCTVDENLEIGILILDYNQHSSNAATLPRRVVKTSTGTEVYFDLGSIMNHITKDEFYIRFRVPHKTLSELLNRKKNLTSTVVSLLTSPIVKVDYTYFIRINEMRTIPNDLRYKSEIQKQKIKKVIVAMSLNGELKVNSSSCYKL